MVHLFIQKHHEHLFSMNTWKMRIMFWGGAILVGLVATFFAYVCNEAEELFKLLLSYSDYVPLVLTPLGFMIAAFLADKIFPGTKGSGIPDVISAQSMDGVYFRDRLISLRIVIGKIFLTALVMVTGGSVGREGPTIQVGAAIMLASGRFFGEARQKVLIVAGGAAGMAAAFNTPLAGIMFAIEELTRDFEKKTASLVLTAIILAGFSSIAITGHYNYFGTTSATLAYQYWPAVLICGVVGGLLGGLFSRFVIAGINTDLPLGIGHFMRKHPFAFAGICGLIIAVMGVFTENSPYGSGYEEARMLVQGEHDAVPFYYGIVKMICTALSSVAGIVGGFFAPALAIGAGFGANIATLFPEASFSAIVLLGMVAYFSGVVQSPITAFVIVFEMTNSQLMLVPVMAASLIASAVSQLVCETSIYHALAGTILRKVSAEKIHGS